MPANKYETNTCRHTVSVSCNYPYRTKALFTRNVCICLSIKRHECIPWYQVEVFTLREHAENGLEPILCLCVCVTIDPIQNFDANVNADAHANVTCKQSLKRVCNSFIMLESVIYDQFSIVDYRETGTVTNIHHSLSENMWGKFGGYSR